MNKKLLFSIVVPVYGAEKYLNRCVRSIQNQTYQNIEIILVDDGSPDECPAMCDAFAQNDSRIQVLHKANGGQGSARKAGAIVASGDYVCCVDADDEIALNYVERMAEVGEQYCPEMICCGFSWATEGGRKDRPLKNREGFYSRQDIQKEIFPELIQTANAEYFSPSIWGKAIKTELYRKQQLCVDDRLKIGEDGACTIPCVYHAQSMYILRECMYYYWDNNSSMTRNRKAFAWDGPELIAYHLEKRLDMTQFDFRQQWYRKITHELFTVVSSQFYRAESYRTITADIRRHLQEPLYQKAIENSQFEGLSGKMARLALKHRLFVLIWLFNKLKN